MKAILDKLKIWIRDDSMPIRNRMVLVLATASMIGSFISVIFTLFLGQWVSFIVCEIAVLFAIWSFYKCIKNKNNENNATLIAICYGLILFPIMYFVSGGVYSGMPCWFIISLLIAFLSLKGKKLILFLTIEIVEQLSIILITYYHSDLVYVHLSRKRYYFDVVQSYVLVALIIGVVVYYQIRIFENAMEKLRKQNELLEKQTVQLEYSRQAAEKANMAKSEFIANMSHELRTPINAVLGMNEMILRESDNKQILEYSNTVRDSGNAILSIISDILDISKIESGMLERVDMEYDVSSLINDCYHMVIARANKKGLKLEVICDENLPSRLKGDFVHIRQVIINFLTNAVKYTDEGYIQFILSGKVENDNVKFKIEVKDTGIGIAKKDMDKLFTKFSRIDVKHNQNIEGTGLGLSISKQLIELMGGELIVDSEYGKGSTFGFIVNQEICSFIPLDEIDLRYNIDDTRAGDNNKFFVARGAKILVVDDLDMNLKVFVNLLKNSEIDIDTAYSGKECLTKIKNRRYDLIFMDHMMPDMDGIETLKEIKNTLHMCDGVPIIALTANAISGAREFYLEAGFDNYLTKPLDTKQLEDMISKYVEGGYETVEKKQTINNEEKPAQKRMEIDIRELYKYTGDSNDIALIVLQEYLNSAPELIDKLDEALNNGDMKNYAVHVHSLKSSSRYIGAMDYGELAFELEKAAKDNDEEHVMNRHKDLKLRLKDILQEVDLNIQALK